MKFNEQNTVENHIIEYLSGVKAGEFSYAKNRKSGAELAGRGFLVADAPRDNEKALGYEYIAPKEFAKLREFENEFIIISLLEEAIKKINKIESDEAQSVIREIKKIDTNQEFLNAMREGIDIKDLKTNRTENYKIIDFEKPENNSFVITNQFYFEGNAENIRPDMLVFLNGLPIVDIEAKSPVASTIISYENAIDQIKRYERNARRLFLPNCFNIATDGLKAVYGATYSPKQYFFKWREENNNNEKNDIVGTRQCLVPTMELEITLDALLSPDKLLDIIKNFILFEKENEKLVKKIARYQQMRAANKIVERVKSGDVKRGLIWHTQGSGKSLTMFFTAWKLRFDQSLKNPKIFVLIDRIDLDDQIYDTFINCGGKNIIRVVSREDLRKKIKSPEKGIFISTIQKFSELGDEAKNLDQNIIVLSDEAHRDNEGISAINLRSAMKSAFFFGFTGTPIDRTTLNTYRNFSEGGERYLDYYSIQQAIDDGATLPVAYEARMSKFFINEENLDKQFEEMTNDLSEKQKNELIGKYGKKAAVVKLEKRMRTIAKDIFEHFKLYVEPNGFKAQVVCYDREATAKYKELFDQLMPKEWSEVVYSSGDPNSGSDDLKKYNTNKARREKIIDDFKNPKHPLKFLLVCDMLLTGFDAPIEQAMYLDKSLRDHNLLQAIARTNRVYANKGYGKVIDYYGITRNLYAALDFDETVVESAMIDLDKVKVEFVKTLNETMDIFFGVDINDPSIENLRKCLKIFIGNEKRQKLFSNKYSKLKLLFEVLSPDPFLKKHLKKFEWITCFYLAFVRDFRGREIDRVILSEYGEKMKELIQKEVDYEGIIKNFRELKINDIYTLERLKKMDDEEKTLNLEKILKQEISINIDDNPAFLKFSERLMAIKNEFEKNQIDLAERIKKYYKLLNDIQDKSKEAERMGLNLREYGLYAISREFIETKDEKLYSEFIKETTSRVEKVLDKGWQDSSKREQFIKDIKRTLQEIILKDYKDKIKTSDFQKYLNRLVDVIIKKF